MNDSWQRMVRDQIRARGITDPRILSAFLRVDRALFVPEELKHRAYADAPLPIGHDQTISQPYIVALMSSRILPSQTGAAPTAEQRVEAQGGPQTFLSATGHALEIGAGCGYQSAILAHLFEKVTSFERVGELATVCRRNLAALGIENVTVHEADGSKGVPGSSFNAILAAAAFSSYPEDLESQLSEWGKMVVPSGTSAQFLYVSTRLPHRINREKTIGVRFVPMIQND